MARPSRPSRPQTLPTNVWPSSVIPPPPTILAITQIIGFLEEVGYGKSAKALKKEATHHGIDLDSSEVLALRGPFKRRLAELYADALLQAEDSSSSEDEEDASDHESTSSEEDPESDDEDSDSSDDDTPVIEAEPGTSKRKRDVDSSDSSSVEEDSEASSCETAPPTKKSKTVTTQQVESSTSSDDDASSVNSSEVTNDSDSAGSEEDSSDSSSEDSSDEEATQTTRRARGGAARDTESDASSATLAASSPIKEEGNDSMHPARANRMTPAAKVEGTKKGNVPFSRIPKNTYVDPRFASNAYVSYDYADRAHNDLIVTKGKGFTKEKNKKKRGSYRGGAIDTAPKGIKFED